jgi:hypothetical protein
LLTCEFYLPHPTNLVTDDDTTVILPVDDLDLGPVDFPSTTDYHWAKFDANSTNGNVAAMSTTGSTSGGYEVVQGPFQFGLATKLVKTKDQVS